ncbi:MAG TPA: ester cyclase [Puia sp.]
MSTAQHNEAIVRRVYEESFNKRNFGILQELVSDDYPPFQGVKGPAGFVKPVEGLVKAFPDINWDIQDLFGEGDKVVIRWKWHGTHNGSFNGYAPTGKLITNEGMAILTLKNGRIVSGELQTDRLGFWQQIDALPKDIIKAGSKEKISLIDKFFVPAASRAEFYERMHINRTFIKDLPGLIQQDAYEHSDQDGNLVCVTIAQWESGEAMDKARLAVQEAYKREGFDMPAMLQRLKITIDRGNYSTVNDRSNLQSARD